MDDRTGARVAQPARSTALPFAVALGHRLRQVREEFGLSAVEMAKRCRECGLNWDRPTLTRVELGQRQVTAQELMMLGWAYDRSISDLLPTEQVVMATVPMVTTATPLGLQEMLTSAPSLSRAAGWHVEGLLQKVMDFLPEFTEKLDAWLSQNLPGANILELRRADRHRKDEATVKAAKALGTIPEAVSVAAERLWRHGLAEERDKRANDLDPLNDRRAMQARRGHMTRTLLKELAPVVSDLTDDAPKSTMEETSRG